MSCPPVISGGILIIAPEVYKNKYCTYIKQKTQPSKHKTLNQCSWWSNMEATFGFCLVFRVSGRETIIHTFQC